MAISYVTTNQSLEFTLPDGYSADYIAMTPPNAKGKISLCRGIDYIVNNGVIKLFRKVPSGTTITISNNIDDIITADITNDFNSEIETIEEISKVVASNKLKIDNLQQASNEVLNAGASFDYLSEASLNNSLSISELYSKIRSYHGGE